METLSWFGTADQAWTHQFHAEKGLVCKETKSGLPMGKNRTRKASKSLSNLEDKRGELMRTIVKKSRPPVRETGATLMTLHKNPEESNVPQVRRKKRGEEYYDPLRRATRQRGIHAPGRGNPIDLFQANPSEVCENS